MWGSRFGSNATGACCQRSSAFRITNQGLTVTAEETLNESPAKLRAADRDGWRGAKRSRSGATTRLCNAARRPSPSMRG